MQTAGRARQTARMIWMLYYNRELLERGEISQAEHDRMRLRIQSRYGESSGDKK